MVAYAGVHLLPIKQLSKLCNGIKTRFQFSVFYFLVNNFNSTINCLNINRVTIYRAQCIGIVALKVLLTR